MGKILESNISKRLPYNSLIARLDRGDYEGLARDFGGVARAKMERGINYAMNSIKEGAK